jgi:hypothetical protein
MCVCWRSKGVGKRFNPVTPRETWEWAYLQTEDLQENLRKVSNVGNKTKMKEAE